MNKLAASLLFASFLPACGLESIFANVLGSEHERPLTVIEGTVALSAPQVTVVGPLGDAVEVLSADASGGTFRVTLPSQSYDNLRLRATQGEAVVKAFVTHLDPESVTPGVTVDAASTMETLIVEAKLGPSNKTLQTLSPSSVRGVLTLIRSAAQQAGPTRDLATWVGRLIAAADVADNAAPKLFRVPVLGADYTTETSAIDPGWLAQSNVDYDGDGLTDTSSSAKFDAKLAEVAQGIDFEECLDPKKLRVVFTADFNAGRVDDNCDVIERFRWAQDTPGKQMFFVGGIHEESPVQDPVVDAMLGNTGGWVPNQIAMHDDGTNGDAKAGDNVWTIYFDLPRGARLGYKYTWGKKGDLWTGSEEWPGNQHILEVVDVNGDDLVYRADDFGDETTNKDKVNLRRTGNGLVTWDTDADGDGVPDARERKVDVDNDCDLDDWVTPSGVGPLTVDCSTIGQ